ncbi:cytochrome c oxidase subunit II [Aureibacter tunicatorum]|uniref:Cytochrome c oxidase subunit 2 n=1 Tax=Aureibacter tunicatorum TaxID=866807 RepID=A0AAE3XPM7_9BACT|nr:cytochrome c oxidase subunit II [Aureibacter tunicatorum]MDR6238984.1 cytochrome c oxidase subunit 2 [Aureibacter tunicatorum]BDD05090.1 cytochrome c oxidase subunit II [Aureibacter tunicatorum]
MINLILATGGILVLVALFLIFRIYTLVGVAKSDGKEYKPVDNANKINAALLGLTITGMLIGASWYSFKYFDEYTIPVASEHGVMVNQLFWVTMAVTGIVFIITHILLFVFSYKYSFKENAVAKFYPDNDKLEIAWTVVPAIALAVLIFFGLFTWNDMTAKAPENAEVVEIMGYQFAWKARYPGKDNKLGDYDYKKIDAVNLFGMDLSDKSSFDDFVPREIHLPKGKPVEFKIRARDVIHSVYAPHFRLKMDAVPGMPTRFGFVPTKSTEEMRQETGDPEFNYEIACTEVCGRGHFSMRILVVVDEPEEYEKWKASQKSWLSKNPEYITSVPEDLKELALLKTGAVTASN